MSSFCVRLWSRDGHSILRSGACVVFVTLGPALVTLCVKFHCDIMYIIISTRL